jgi:hypothetical protein
MKNNCDFHGGTYGQKNIAVYLAILLILTSFMAYLGIVPPNPYPLQKTIKILHIKI